MNYEKAYKAVLQTAKQWIKDGCTDKEKICLECVFPELRESEDERIRKVIYKLLLGMRKEIFTTQDEIVTKDKALAYLEKQKEPHYTKRNALFDKCVENCDPKVMREVSDEIDEMLGKKQKPNIELIQRSWYMEGYHDREFGKEPKWIIKTGEGGPKHELNPKYGQPLTEEPKPVEWSEEDERILKGIIGKIDHDQTYGVSKVEMLSFLKSLRPSWKPSEEQMSMLLAVINDPNNAGAESCQLALKSLYEHLKGLM